MPATKKQPATRGAKASATSSPQKTPGASKLAAGKAAAPSKPAASGAKAAVKAVAGRAGKAASAASAASLPAVPLATPARAKATFDALHAQHPDAHCALDHRNAFELLCATVLSAQTTDVGVNKATPALFAKYPTAESMAKAEPVDLEPLVSTLGFFRMKSKSLVGLARALVKDHGGQVPQTIEELVKLPGVGRKTANVILGVIWNKPEGVVVDTHVQRLSQRLGWTHNTDPVAIEKDLSALLPRADWDMTSHVLIFHGRRVCIAAKPNCEGCHVNVTCPSAFDAVKVGRKPPKARVVAGA